MLPMLDRDAPPGPGSFGFLSTTDRFLTLSTFRLILNPPKIDFRSAKSGNGGNRT